MMRKTSDLAIGKWYGILKHLGVPENFLSGKHQSCPLCQEGKDRFRWDNKRGEGTYFCSQCGAGSGMDFAMRWTGLDFAEAAKRVDEIVGSVPAGPIKPQHDPLPALRRLQERIVGMDGINPVRRYLKSRGLLPAPATRFCAAWKYWDDGKPLGVYPVMVHQFVAADGSPLTWHLTYLTPEGEKAPVPASRKVMPPAGEMAGGSIRLYRAGPVLGVAEGIETAIAAHQITGHPVWACCSANLLEQFVPPAGTEHVVIFGDNDASFTGQKAAYVLAHRLKREGYKVTVDIPAREGSDFADALRAEVGL